jgi:antitoxin component YwqK of YwqJK toxin-antitoxin module
MKWKLLILPIVLIACGREVTITESEIVSDIFYAGNDYRPFSGKCLVVFNDTSLIREQFTYKHGILHGESRAWYLNGKLRRKGCYAEGKLSGTWEFWDEQGNKILEADFSNDELNGSYTALNQNGSVKEKGQYRNNKRTGKWTGN